MDQSYFLIAERLWCRACQMAAIDVQVAEPRWAHAVVLTCSACRQGHYLPLPHGPHDLTTPANWPDRLHELLQEFTGSATAPMVERSHDAATASRMEGATAASGSGGMIPPGAVVERGETRLGATSDAPTCVVVDDEPTIVEVVCDVLEEAGISAAGITQSTWALQYIRSTQPELVILDVQMPGQTGIDLFHQLRQDPSTQNLPVIFLTANSHLLDHLLPNYAELGAMLLPKPFSMANLVSLVNGVLAAA